jgi:hypothetical protein
MCALQTASVEANKAKLIKKLSKIRCHRMQLPK